MVISSILISVVFIMVSMVIPMVLTLLATLIKQVKNWSMSLANVWRRPLLLVTKPFFLMYHPSKCLPFPLCLIVKPGMKYRDFGKVIEEHATKNGFTVVRAFVGHGINQMFHCAPNVPHYASKFCPRCLPSFFFSILFTQH